MTGEVLTASQTLLAFLLSPAKQRQYQARGRNAVGGKKNACAATASQPLFELAIISKVYTWAEDLVTACKKTKRFSASANREDVKAGDLIVCIDGDGPGGPDGNDDSDHVWFVLQVIGDGWYLCFDNQGPPHRRRLDGADGKTPMRGRLRLMK